MKNNKCNIYLIITLLLFSIKPTDVVSQTLYNIAIDKPEKEILRGHLDLGGKNPDGEEISVNSYFIEKNGKPFFPIIGEFHYSRFPTA
ncbi:MAG: glycosyl hydrolase family 35, partial [Bacteroidales bacterium]|nr:glycosyl hydrolase family 35 [Bacteroidales bacterium]